MATEIASLIKDGHSVTIPVKGNSMAPFLIDGRDSVTLSRCNVDELKPGAVVMALAGNQDTVVLHRIIAREGEWLTLQGDGNPLITEKANVNDVVGIAVSFVRKGKTYEADSLPWRAFSSFWMSSARLRRMSAGESSSV